MERDRRRGDRRKRRARRWARPARRAADWSRLPEERLLDRSLASLRLRIEGSPLEPRVEQLGEELARVGLRFRPRIWVSTDWFSPDGVPGFAVPFYLLHPRLVRLERKHLRFCEGSTHRSCMQLLRHETGHAIDTAYRLRRRAGWRRVFGAASLGYRRSYVPRPASRRFVQNLNGWYAQSHPVEDFAETFAVWLGSHGLWRKHYAGWPALAKLEYVDALMREIGPARPLVASRERPESIAVQHASLRDYYERKGRRYGAGDDPVYDRDLARLFGSERRRGRRRAAAFLGAHRSELRRVIARWTDWSPKLVDEAIDEMIRRCRALGLYLAHAERESFDGAVLLVTMHSLRIQRTRHREYLR